MDFDTDSQGILVRWLGGFLRVFFNLLYNEFAWGYDMVAWIVSLGRWPLWTTSLLPYLHPEDHILELGHGTGNLVEAAHLKGFRLIGLDASQNMGHITFNRMNNIGVEPLLVNGYAQSLPFDADQFTKVAATFPSEYIIDPRTISEIKRILKPRGQLLIIPAAYIEGTSIPDRVFARLFRLTRQAPDPLDPDTLRAFAAPLVAAEFMVKTEKLVSKSSSVLLIKATNTG